MDAMVSDYSSKDKPSTGQKARWQAAPIERQPRGIFAPSPLSEKTKHSFRERESSGQWAATKRSSRVPASVATARSSCISGWAPSGTEPHGPTKFGGRPVLAPFTRRRTLRYKSIPRVAVRVAPLYVAEIVAEVEMSTRDVLTVKVALVAPGETVTLVGTLAAPLLLERNT
jgi:hypothetical protein